jgi:hypothetical protein
MGLASGGTVFWALHAVCPLSAANPIANGHYNAGNRFTEVGETAKAVQSYKRAIEIQPSQ